MLKVTLNDVKKAQETIKGVVKETPVLESKTLSEMTGANVFYKCENLQKTGSFKVRGAVNTIANLTDVEKANGVIASSAGNHAQGVALGAQMTGIKATIVMPATAPLAKVSATRGYGAEVVLNGEVYDDAYAKAVEIQKETGATFIHPFNNEHVMAGQGTIALEIFEQLNSEVDTILCPIGGGGIIAGVAVAAKALNPNVKVIGVQTSNIPSMQESVKNGEVTTAFKAATIADGIAVKSPGEKTFEIVGKYVDEIITVTESEIVDAFLLLSEKHKLLGEASGVVSLAALNKIDCNDKKICSVISGGNIDMLTISNLINNGLVSGGRLFCFSVELPDVPGQLVEISQILSEENANVVKLEHNQFKAINRINNVLLEVTVETNGHEHINQIIKHFNSRGYKINIMYKG